MSQNASDSSSGRFHNRPESSDSAELPQAPESGFAGSSVASGDRSFKMEANANRLMDDLFAEVERMLDRGVQFAPEVEEAKPTVPNAVASPTLTMSSKLAPRELLLQDTLPESLDLTGAEADLWLEVSQVGQAGRQGKSFDKLLLAAIVTSLAVTGTLWFLFQDKLQISHLPFFNPSQPAEAPVAKAPAPTPEELEAKQNTDFLKYIGRSLDRIDRTTKEARQAIAAAKASDGTATPATAPTVLERIYVPIYQPPQNLPQPTITTIPLSPQPNTAHQAPNAPAARTNSSPVNPSTAAAPNIAASVTHVLVGVLELGDRSAALFEFNGTTQRVQVGERIGSTDWTLVDINNQEALVRRNGEVRSIYVGQKF